MNFSFVNSTNSTMNSFAVVVRKTARALGDKVQRSPLLKIEGGFRDPAAVTDLQDFASKGSFRRIVGSKIFVYLRSFSESSYSS